MNKDQADQVLRTFAAKLMWQLEGEYPLDTFFLRCDTPTLTQVEAAFEKTGHEEAARIVREGRAMLERDLGNKAAAAAKEGKKP